MDANVRLEIENLSEDAIIEILTRIQNVDDMMACRFVCQQWGQLAIHCDVWSNRAEEDFHHWGTSEVLIALRVLPCLPSLQLTQAGMRVILKIVVHLKGDITYHNANFAFFYRTHDPRDERRLVADSCVGRLRYCELVPENNM